MTLDPTWRDLIIAVVSAVLGWFTNSRFVKRNGGNP